MKDVDPRSKEEAERIYHETDFCRLLHEDVEYGLDEGFLSIEHPKYNPEITDIQGREEGGCSIPYKPTEKDVEQARKTCIDRIIWEPDEPWLEASVEDMVERHRDKKQGLFKEKRGQKDEYVDTKKEALAVQHQWKMITDFFRSRETWRQLAEEQGKSFCEWYMDRYGDSGFTHDVKCPTDIDYVADVWLSLQKHKHELDEAQEDLHDISDAYRNMEREEREELQHEIFRRLDNLTECCVSQNPDMWEYWADQ